MYKAGLASCLGGAPREPLRSPRLSAFVQPGNISLPFWPLVICITAANLTMFTVVLAFRFYDQMRIDGVLQSLETNHRVLWGVGAM